MRTFACIVLLLSCLANLPLRAAVAPEPREFFESRIRPVLANQCHECHGPSKQEGGLRVDSRTALQQGGESGPALVVGNAKASRLVQVLAQEHPRPGKTNDKLRLAGTVIADFVTWIDQGAFDPRDVPASSASRDTNSAWPGIFAARKDWWSFQPVEKPAAPEPRDTGWSDHPVDRFLLVEMERRGLRPAVPADRRTLVRRLAFALTGLPPKPDEVRLFLEDARPEAVARLVDQLLASPRFGERWARHWMDLVRFAETHGSEGDPAIPEAWRYRDYLIRAFNADVPCDQLIGEHLAGDLLPNPRWNETEGFNESILGTAHLRLVEHGFQAVDTLDDQIKTVDSQIDVLSKAFQGLTTSCARCHDHKFDPISQRDYYALFGVFASVRPTQVTIDAPERLRVHRTELEKLKHEIKSALADAWSAAAKELSQQLLGWSKPGEANRLHVSGDELNEEIAELERRIATINNAGRRAALTLRGTPGTNQEAPPTPMSAWTFEGDARDHVGGLHGELQAGAMVRDGRLILDGKSAFVRTAPLERGLREKTLEAWVILASLDQQGGGAMTIETLDGRGFDSIVFGEQEARRWMAGSDGFARTRSANGPAETAKPGELVHLAIVYRTDHSIALYRNGAPYGSHYTPGESAKLRAFEAGAARVLFGMRHTGGGNPFLAGELEEARLYDRALEGAEVMTSFKAGPGLVTPDQVEQALTHEQRKERASLQMEVDGKRTELAARFPDYVRLGAVRARLLAALEAAAKVESHPLHPWVRLRGKSDEWFRTEWQSLSAHWSQERIARRKFNQEKFQMAWDLAGDSAPTWFRHGINPPELAGAPGDFCVEPEGDRALPGLLPAGIFSHGLSQKHNGVLTSPRFKVESDSISVRALGGKGARVRLIADNYPLGAGSIFPQANLSEDAPGWIRLDTAYRKGSWAYLEFATADEVIARDRPSAGAGGRSFFGVERIVFHNGKETPKEEFTAMAIDWPAAAPASLEDLARQLNKSLSEAIDAWRTQSLSEEQRVLLDAFVRAGLLPSQLGDLPTVAPLVTAFRRLENQVPVPRRAPGVLETVGMNAPFLPRGDHTKPQDSVPRGYIQLAGSLPYHTSLSGRLELANELASATNPLTARVMVNRVWHHLFGRGLVATVDNFGHLGEKPSHSQLLDFLAARFVEQGWSFKELIRFLVLTRAFQMSSEPSERAREFDPDNQWLSHARVRRLDAEVIRDSLLAIVGRLDVTMFGPGVNAVAPPADQRRRSIYLTIRRNNLSPFLQVFDAPKPFTTLGRRNVTNVPAQSLAFLNDPFVIEQAGAWASSLLREGGETDQYVRRTYERVLARPPTESELAFSLRYLEDLVRLHGNGQPLSANELAWKDFTQSLFNLKEFIYLR